MTPGVFFNFVNHLMKSNRLSGRLGVLTALSLSVMLVSCDDDSSSPAPAPAPTPAPAPVALANQLYTQTNDTANAIVHFTRSTDGTLVRAESTPTSGAGTAAVGVTGTVAPDSLAGQHSLVISADHTMLFVVNAGDDSISSFSINQMTGATTLLKKSAATAGHFPNSLAVSNGKVYATFRAGTSSMAAYNVGTDGSLTQIGAYDLTTLGSLAAAATPTQSVVSPDGKTLVVNAGPATNAIMTFPIQADGTLGTPVTTANAVVTPFAGEFVPGATQQTYLVSDVSEVKLDELSLTAGAFTQTSTAAFSGVPGVAAPCWMALTPDGKTAFIGNGSGAISSFSIGTSGLTLLNATAAEEPGVKTGVTAVAADSWISADGKFLYTAYIGDDKVVAYSIGLDGSLAKLGEQVIGTSTGLSLQGLTGI
jgi:6-phosphogluconolactonase